MDDFFKKSPVTNIYGIIIIILSLSYCQFMPVNKTIGAIKLNKYKNTLIELCNNKSYLKV